MCSDFFGGRGGALAEAKDGEGGRDGGRKDDDDYLTFQSDGGTGWSGGGGGGILGWSLSSRGEAEVSSPASLTYVVNARCR